MNPTNRHRRVARAVWETGGRLDEAARREGVRPETLRRWLAAPEFRALLAEEALEPLLQAASAVMRWAPAAVARLIRDLDGESASDARQAAREILRLALEAQRNLASGDAPAADVAAGPGAPGSAAGLSAEDPLSRQVARLSDEQVKSIFAILNDADATSASEPRP
jgi:transposase-like protein